MTLYDFNGLDEMEQIEVIWDSVKLAIREEEEFTVTLYAVFDFYVEFYHTKLTGAARGIRSFSSTNPLELYLDNIDISDINP